MSPDKKPTAWEEAVINYKASKACAANKKPLKYPDKTQQFFSKQEERAENKTPSSTTTKCLNAQLKVHWTLSQ